MDHRQQIVEVVREPAGQLPDRLHLLGLAQAILGLAQRNFGAASLEDHLDGDVQLALGKRLDQVAIGLGRPRPLQRRLFGMGRQVDDRRRVFRGDPSRRVDPVHIALDMDVHQDDVRVHVLHLAKGLGARRDDRQDLIAELHQLLAQMEGDDAFVLDDRDAGSCRGHVHPYR